TKASTPLLFHTNTEINPKTKPTGKIYFPFTYGIRNFPRGISLSCKTKTPAQTNEKANKVPILHKSVTMVKFINNAGTATTKPVTIVANDGVLYFGCTLENFLGNSPSRLILIQILGCPI